MRDSNERGIPFSLILLFGILLVTAGILTMSKINTQKASSMQAKINESKSGIFIGEKTISPVTNAEIDTRLKFLDKESLEVDSSFKDVPITNL